MGQIEEKETSDQVVEETRRIKEVLARSLDFDIERILKASRDNQTRTGRRVLSPPVRGA